jgi:hypothetical protein
MNETQIMENLSVVSTRQQNSVIRDVKLTGHAGEELLCKLLNVCTWEWHKPI